MATTYRALVPFSFAIVAAKPVDVGVDIWHLAALRALTCRDLPSGAIRPAGEAAASPTTRIEEMPCHVLLSRPEPSLIPACVRPICPLPTPADMVEILMVSLANQLRLRPHPLL